MNPRSLTTFLLLGLCLVLNLPGAVRPDVILILADDLGWADTRLYGHTSLYETPHLERLAKRGMLFTRAYANSPLCSPTRASLLTGQTPARHGSTAPVHHTAVTRLRPVVRPSAAAHEKALQVDSVTRLDTRLPTLGGQFRRAGYATGHFGKWHLGPEPYSALEHGFDMDVPHWPGPGPAGSYVAPWKYPSLEPASPKEHIEDRMAAEAVKWMQSVPKDQSLFLNYWQFSVHAPFDAKQELIESYRTRIDRDRPQRSAVYAAMVKSLDDAVGTLFDAVEAAGRLERTIFVFTSDNGGNMYNGIAERDAEGREFTTAPTSNRPLRGGKATLYEGGIRVPTIVVWPGVTAAGSRSEEIIQTSDFYPTLLAGLGIPLPEGHSVDGVDISPALRGESLKWRAIFTFFPHAPGVPDWLPPAAAVHAGDWKLIRLFHEGENGAHDYRLYDLKRDLGEANNLAASEPDRVRALDRLLDEHLRQTGAVVPLPNPRFDPAQYRPDRIGIQAGGLKVSGQAGKRSKTATPKPGVARSVKGWRAGGTAALQVGEGRLLLRSTGGDPQLLLAEAMKWEGGPFRLRVRLRSTGATQVLAFCNPPFQRGGFIKLGETKPGEWGEVEGVFEVGRLTGLRIDPLNRTGLVEFDWIRVEDADRRLVKRWEF